MVKSTYCFDFVCLIYNHIAASTNTKHVSFRPMPRHNELFTGREVFLEELRQYFCPRHKSRPRRSLLITGMGGAGKTQISFKFAEKNLDMLVALVNLCSSGCSNAPGQVLANFLD